MAEIKKFVEVPHSNVQMFELVKNLQKYPDIVEWCNKITVISNEPHKIIANVEGTKLGMNFVVTVVYLIHPQQMIEIRPNVGGPFRRFQGIWRFSPLDATHSKFGLELNLEFSTVWLGWTLTPIIKSEMNHLLKSFSQKAKEIYG